MEATKWLTPRPASGRTSPPPGDGKELDWWFTDAVLHPKPSPTPEKPRPPITISWRELQERGFADIEVLGGLGELRLRPPIAPMEGPNRAARERGRAIIREALRRVASREGAP